MPTHQPASGLRSILGVITYYVCHATFELARTLNLYPSIQFDNQPRNKWLQNFFTNCSITPMLTKYTVRLELRKDTNNLQNHYRDAIVKHVPKPIHAAKDFHAKLTFAWQRHHAAINVVNTVNVVNGTVNIEDFNVTGSTKLSIPDDYITDSTLIISPHRDSRSRPRHQYDDECK